MKTLSAFIVLIILFSLSFTKLYSQNVAITDDAGYTAEPSAMLDVKSTTKGMLVPRVTTLQREAIASPTAGLLVFDTDDGNFYFNTSSGWISLTSASNALWTKTGANVHLATGTDNVGVGTSTPLGKLEVKGDVPVTSNDPLFEVINSNGDTVFAVFSQGVHIRVADDTAAYKATASKGGFAVGGFSLTKGLTNEYLRVTPDSVRVYIDDDYTPSKAAGSKGGFAVGGFSLTKGNTNDYLFIQDDSSRVYVKGDEGFAVDNIAAGNEGRYLDMMPENYFIGHQSGQQTTIGLYNLLCGYESGFNNQDGSNNSFFGYRTGFNNESGSSNTFIGYESGYSNEYGENNTFVGNLSGYSNIGGTYNSFFGYMAGNLNTSGTKNTFIGSYSGASTTYGYQNSFVGYQAGYNNVGGYLNTFVGQESGFSNNTGYRNTFIGAESGKANTNGFYNTFVGSNAGQSNLGGDGNSFLGPYAGSGNTSGNYNTFLGSEAGYTNSTASYNAFVGYKAGFSNTNGTENTYLGYEAGYGNTTGDDNVAVGTSAGFTNSTGGSNVYMGNTAGMYSPGGGGNVMIGAGAGQSAGSVSSNVFIGSYAGRNTTQNYNVFIGRYAGESNAGGSSNIYIGYEAGRDMTGLWGNNNVFIGTWAAQNKTQGQNNVYIGGGTGANNLTGYNCVFIGQNAGASETGHRKLYLDSQASSTTPVETLIYGEFDNEILAFDAAVGIGTVTPSYDFHIVRTNADIGLNNIEIADMGSYNLGLGADVVPYDGASGAHDVGNNATDQYWDDMVALDFITFSDINTKEDINDINIGLEEILKLRPVQFKYKPNIDIENKVRYGLIAQEVEETIPIIVKNDETDMDPETGEIITTPCEYKGLNYMELIPVLIKSIQELQEIVDEQNIRIKKFEEK